MKSKKKIIKQNTAAINEFISWYGEDSSKEFSEFIFELQGLYLGRSDVAFTKEGAADAVNKFGILYRLVNGIQVVE